MRSLDNGICHAHAHTDISQLDVAYRPTRCHENFHFHVMHSIADVCL